MVLSDVPETMSGRGKNRETKNFKRHSRVHVPDVLSSVVEWFQVPHDVRVPSAAAIASG